jgi:hypothetical protein
MDAIRFDRLTRRLVLSGLTTGSLAALLDLDEVATKKKKRSKRKRCRQKKRTFCAGRCCPKRHHCEAKACVQSCENPFVCPDQGGGSGCGAGTNCFCSTTIRGTTACVISESAPCEDSEPCGPADSCPAGLICAICGCDDATPGFRCKRPCPAG